jgi:hypothetical protein
LGNDIAIKAFQEGKLPFPDGTIIAALHWNEVSSDPSTTAAARACARSPTVALVGNGAACTRS